MNHPNQSQYPMVSVISVNYNQAEATVDMLGSLENLTYPNYEVIVVDNLNHIFVTSVLIM